MSIPEKRVAVLNVVALTSEALKQMPFLSNWAANKKIQNFPPAFPALTCPAQSTYITGLPPEQHSCIANGWYSRKMSEHQFWKQSNKLVQGPRIWEELQQKFGKDFTCAKLFWWYNMYSTANWTITPRPMYPADGRKVFDIYTQPMDLRETIKKDLGEFPFPSFWGPASDIGATQWIVESAKWIERKHQPNLSLVYLPYLDYDLQRYGPYSKQATSAFGKLDQLLFGLISFYEKNDIEVIVLSEYGISEVSDTIALNRFFRKKGWITIKPELETEMLDCGASKAFAISDHQVALVYLNDPSIKKQVVKLLNSIKGIEQVIENEPGSHAPDSADRIPDLTVTAAEGYWFSYYYWLDDKKAPDFARCVDIHRKPGYDPAELFLDQSITFPSLKAAIFLLKKKLGFRALLKLIPLHGKQVRGSHGRANVPDHEKPVFISSGYIKDIHKPEDVFNSILSAFDTISLKK